MPSLKTQIMYKANLSFTQLSAYLEFMLENNLIIQKDREGREIYVITSKVLMFFKCIIIYFSC